jgi:hypothetical protein
VCLLSVVAVLAAGCADSSSKSKSAPSGGRTLSVPADYATVQKAVDASKPGDLILISPGVYTETGSDGKPAGVTVETDRITIRGLDRNTTILDGKFEAENGIKVFSNDVAVENLTIRNNTGNGLFFTGDYGKGFTLTGYRASYVTAYDNGDYGIYAFNTRRGQIDHSYGSGQPDSAFYVGQCNPCDSLLTDDIGEANMLGYSGTNSTGVTIVNSIFRNNRAGIVPNSEYGEKLYPNNGTTIIGNLVENNQNPVAPNSPSVAIAWGNGIVLGGTSHALVERNLVRGQVNAGIVITDYPATTDPATGQQATFKPQSNTVRKNTLTGNHYDLAYLTVNYASRPFGNCYEQNTFTSSFPDGLEAKMPCKAGNDVDLGDLSGILKQLNPPAPDNSYKDVPAPPNQPSMPDAATAKALAATGVTGKVDTSKIAIPTG